MLRLTTLLIALSLASAGCSKPKDAPPTATVEPASAPAPQAKDPALARKLIADGATVIDVRTPEEFASGHVDRAVNIPIEQFASHLDEVSKLGPKDHAIVVYCGSGHRAAKAQVQLSQAGYKTVVNGGGFDDLQ